MRTYAHFKTYQKVISMFLVASFLIVPLSVLTFPKKAEAVCTPFMVLPTPNPLAVPVSTAMDPTKQVDRFQEGNTFFKNCVLDGLATLIAKTIIKALTKSIVQWINSGFKGNPSFVQNPGAFFSGIADKVAGNMIEKIAPELCSPFKLNIQLALALSQTGGDELSCTLTDVEKNFSDFVNGSLKGGGSWDNWFKITQEPQNNPYGAMMIAQSKLKIAVETAQGKYEKQLDWGSGFLSFEDCPTQIGGMGKNGVSDANQNIKDQGRSVNDLNNQGIQSAGGNVVMNEPKNYSNNSLASIGSLGLLDSIFSDTSKNNSLAQVPVTKSDAQKAADKKANAVNLWSGTSLGTATHRNPNNPKDRTIYDSNNQPVYGVMAGDNGCTTKTPGAVVESQLENFLGSDLRGLEIAQSIDQIVEALVGQLISQTLGGIGGLMGAGKSSSSGSNSGYDYQKLIKSAGIGGVVKIPTLPIMGSCVPNKQNAQIGDVVTWDAYVPDINGSVTYQWYGDENLTGTGASATTSYATNGEKTASVIITTTGTDAQSVQMDCTPNVKIGDSPAIANTPTISCAVSPSIVSINTPVTWQAITIGGISPFTYSWEGSDGLTSTSQTAIKSYASSGTKTATVYATSADGYTYSKTCANSVTVTP